LAGKKNKKHSTMNKRGENEDLGSFFGGVA
jgi:hypothetical protein